MNIMEEIEREGLKADLPNIKIGDDVNVTLKVVEGETERTQVFAGTVIAKKGSGMRQSFTVRRIVQGEGVERVFPLCSPSIVSIETTRGGKTKRSKLYYLRDRVGKATKVKESLMGLRAADSEPKGSILEDEGETATETNDGQETESSEVPKEE